MAWKYKKDEEAAKGCPVGKHEATLAAVEDKVSRNGNNMRVCTFTVYLPGGGEYRVKDYFVEGNGYAVARMHDLANALGAEQDWESETFDAAEWLQTNLVVEVGHKQGDEYTRIVGFEKLVRGSAAGAPSKQAVKAASVPPDDDSIPF
jgi:hypothetical protein